MDPLRRHYKDANFQHLSLFQTVITDQKRIGGREGKQKLRSFTLYFRGTLQIKGKVRDRAEGGVGEAAPRTTTEFLVVPKSCPQEGQLNIILTLPCIAPTLLQHWLSWFRHNPVFLVKLNKNSSLHRHWDRTTAKRMFENDNGPEKHSSVGMWGERLKDNSLPRGLSRHSPTLGGNPTLRGKWKLKLSMVE